MSSSDDCLLPAVAQDRPKERTASRSFSFATICVSLAILAVTGLVLTGFWTQISLRTSSTVAQSVVLEIVPDVIEPEDPYDTSNFLRGEPSKRFRDNLLPEHKYITSWISAGWTNDVMTFMNLIYLGLITERIPVIPMFVPSHIGSLEQVPPLPFGEVFDLPRLRAAIQSPVIEWHELKNINSHEVESIGCWNVWQSVQVMEEFPRRSVSPYLLQLDISYTQAPSWVKLHPDVPHDPHTTFWDLAILAFPEGRKQNLREPLESEVNKVRLPPDEQMLCYDYLYYVSAKQVFEFDADFSPAWRYVGQHLRWSQRVNQLVDEYVRRTIGVADDEKTPTWISVHVRHGDFAGWCGDVPPEECFAPLSVVARRVDEVKKELLDTRGVVVDNVIMTSDERDPAWWDDVQSRGWLRVNHTETVENYGEWFPVLIDAGIQSSGIGFVGTDRSTMSVLARRRVQSWQEGSVRTVKWGRIGADDH